MILRDFLRYTYKEDSHGSFIVSLIAIFCKIPSNDKSHRFFRKQIKFRHNIVYDNSYPISKQRIFSIDRKYILEMENEKTAAEESISTQKTLASCHDPGWNDPPKWAFSPSQNTSGTPTKRLLNKRVAFPLSSGSPLSSANQSGVSLAGNLPPTSQEAAPLTSAPHAPFFAPTILQSTNSSTEIDKKKALSEAMENLEIIINKELEFSNKKEEVRRRLDTMKIMWEEDKLKNTVYEKVLGISKALRNNDVELADKIHISLMMDDAALCNTWISGIRHIILELREKLSQESKLSSTEQDEHPYLLPQSVQNCKNE